MGNWNINIQGVGAHHNGKSSVDADLAAAEFVNLLRQMGQQVESASFTSGVKTDLGGAPPMTATIIINGKSETVDSGFGFGYEDVVALAGMQGQPSMTYAKAFMGREGILTPGQVVFVCDGTVFSVCHTGNA